MALTYAEPIDKDGKPVQEWDDLELWRMAFRKLDGRWRRAKEGDSISFNIGTGSANGGYVRRYSKPFRDAFHSKANLFRRVRHLRGVPKTFCLPAEAAAAAATVASSSLSSTWFLKTSSESRGDGVSVMRAGEENWQSSSVRSKLDIEGVLQSGIERPMRRKEGGEKIDIRMIAFAWPRGEVYAMEKLFVRAAPERYDAQSSSRGVHLTNLSKGGAASVAGVAEKEEEREEVKEESMEAAFQLAAEVMEEMDGCIERGRYNTLGVDIGLDEEGAAWLLEVNSTPHLFNCNAASHGLVVSALAELVDNIHTYIDPSFEPHRSGSVLRLLKPPSQQ